MAIDPARFGLPDASTTGVKAGTTLKPYSGPMNITEDGTVIENAIIDGTLSVKAANVTIKNSVIQNFAWWGIEGEGAENLRVENSEFVGLGATEATNSAILGSGTFVNNDIQGVAIGIQLTDGASTVRGNYIHDLASNAADPHYDGITALGGQSNVLMEGNSIIVPQDHGTASILIQNTFGPVSNVMVRDNLMLGDPSYSLYVDASRDGGPITGVTVEDNYVDQGAYGYFSVTNSDPIIRNNVQWQEGVDPTPYPTDQSATTETAPAETEATSDAAPTQPEDTSDAAPAQPEDTSDAAPAQPEDTSDAAPAQPEGTSDTAPAQPDDTSDAAPAQPEDTSDAAPAQPEDTSDAAQPEATGGAGNDSCGDHGDHGDHKDTFVFDTAISDSNKVDRITDFSVADDVIHLDNAVFTALADTGALADSAFVKNKAGLAQDANDRIIYETDTGELYYDANGSAAGDSIHFATLKAHLDLAAADFTVI
ncbi:right-handed parallel beta-helix repeat-containing protein [Mesorhizobium sp. 1B3]|uniref:right-handed parallel beta-helix repeat-containing protein n=1 Tax=Mesorhizobium sp. 1B3 TaxID=3243599 RepID=UPI003D9829D2